MKAVIRTLVTLLLATSNLAAMANWAPTAAHPHVWIDLRGTVVLDAKGQVTAIEQEWLFDPFYTIFATEGLSGAEDALTSLARENLGNLRSHDYFTEVRADGAKAPLGTVSVFESELRGGRLWMRFVVPLVTAIDPTKRVLTYAVFDPTYYIEILHLEDYVVAFRGAGASDCSGYIVPPSPSTEAVMLAQAMDRDAAPDNMLGGIFAERVEVSCR
ncbi:MAG: DUF1007 family protein [Alphaproteobacteria bacterium]|nr:DUF1007 family protein [Alphaproteobacteria bacterium]